MSDQSTGFNVLAAKLKLQTEQRIRYQQELSSLSAKFQEFKDLQENIQLALAHNHQAEVDSWQEKYATLQATYKLEKERSADLAQTPQLALEDENLQLKDSLTDLQHKLKTEKIRSQQNLKLFVATQAKLSALQDQVAGQQLSDVNLAHLISLQQQIDQIAIEKLKNPSASASTDASASPTDQLSQQYPTPVLLLEEIQLLKAQRKKDQDELVQLRLQTQEMADLQAQLNGSSTSSRSENAKVAQLEQDLRDANELIAAAQSHEDQYKAEIASLQALVKDQNESYQNLLAQYNSTHQRLKQSHEDFASTLTQEMAQLSLAPGNSAVSLEESDQLAEAQHLNQQQQIQLETLRQEIAALTSQNDELITEITESKQTIDLINDKHSELEATLVELNQHKQSLAQTANAQIKTVLEAVTLARQERDTFRQEVVDKDALLIKLQARYQAELTEQRQQQIGHYIAQLQDIQAQLTEFQDELMQVRDYVASLGGHATKSAADDAGANNLLGVVKGYIKTQNDQLAFLKERYDKEVKLRKSIFNQLQELKGNIRVYARLRPISQAEKAAQNDAEPIQCLNDSELRVIQEANGKKTVYPFEFEHVFGPSTTQEQVFEEVKDLIMSCIDGYNVCLFAYGQTGSGKTFSMEGAQGNLRGVNPRALEMLFNYTNSSSDEWDWTIKLTMVEVYNEKIQDLLRTSDAGDINLKIVAGKDGKNEVQGCNQVQVTSAEEVAQFLARGKKNRHMSATQMNAESSRSHLVVTVYTHGYNRLTKVTSTGRLNLVDLAGSERVSRSGVTGEGLKEAQNINASLSNLGSVIAARANKQAHVPYRNSQLTYLLQDSLDKNSKTLMLVQLSPSVESVGETLCSLRFAARVKEVELGKATSSKTAG